VHENKLKSSKTNKTVIVCARVTKKRVCFVFSKVITLIVNKIQLVKRHFRSYALHHILILHHR